MENAKKQQIKFFLNSREKAKNNQKVVLSYADVASGSFQSKIKGVFNPAYDVKFIIHGFTSNADAPDFVAMMEALLDRRRRDRVNVIRVDWRRGARSGRFPNYVVAHKNTKVVGKEVAKFIHKLVQVQQGVYGWETERRVPGTGHRNRSLLLGFVLRGL